MQGHPDVTFVSATGNKYTMRFSVKAWAALHDHYGITSLSELATRFTDPKLAGAKDIVAGIWGALQTHHQGITMEQVTEMLDEIGLHKAQELLLECLSKSTATVSNGDTPPKKETEKTHPLVPQP